MKVSFWASGRLERTATFVLSASLLGILYILYAKPEASDGRVAPRLPAPMPVYSEAVPDSVWKNVTRRGHLIGRSTATDTLVVFSDYECPACSAAARVLDSLLVHRPHIAVLHRHFPLSNRPYAFEEALAVECAGRLGRLDEGQAAMYGRGGAAVDPVRVSVGLNIAVERFVGCWRGEQARSAVEEDRALARSLGLARTPSVFYSGKQWSHIPKLDQLLSLISPEQ